MDTPDRNQIGTPVSKIEESPFSNFANSLSPINSTKSIHISQTFSSLSFTSPPSVFTSPQVSLQKESRLLRRHQVSGLAKLKLSTDEGNKDLEVEHIVSADQQHQYPTNEQVRGEGASSSKASVVPLDDSKCATTELPRVLKYDSGSPECGAANSPSIKSKCEPDMSAAIVPYVQEPSVTPIEAEPNSQGIDHDNYGATCDWHCLISGSSDLFVFDSPNDARTLKGPFQKSLQEETTVFAPLLSCFPHDNANHLPNSCYAGPIMSTEGHERIDQSIQSTETNELGQMGQPPEDLAMSSAGDYISADSVLKSGNESLHNLHRGLRRRCLDFEMPAKKSIDGALFPVSSSSLNDETAMSDNEQPVTPTCDSSRCVVPGIGLHLNALAALSKDSRVHSQETPPPRSQEALLKSSSSVSSEKDIDPGDNGLLVVEDSSQASMHAATEELHSNSPKKKRRKFENVGEGEGCKRCNCKKSKCLKLYCECFAAGVYCVGSCSCQDCFNKPTHEETVLATRKQIESRNPLAFAPKVIRTLDSTKELREDSTRTPASARHKRGCNCKKSNCLKKYCECYQGGVGCSISCRCEGCKNAFGIKDDIMSSFKSGPTLLGAEVEIEKARTSEKLIINKNSDLPAFGNNDEDHNSELGQLNTPLRLFRSSISLPNSSKGKPPRSSTTTMDSSSYLDPIDGPGRSTFLRSQPRFEKFQGASGEEMHTVLQNSSPPSSVKTLSPNSKRISPPHHENGSSTGLRSSRKLILQSIPSFPSLTPRR